MRFLSSSSALVFLGACAAPSIPGVATTGTCGVEAVSVKALGME
ncbi:MAG: hypothetical protein AAGA20_16325 [Planctomycetota bacterium]